MWSDGHERLTPEKHPPEPAQSAIGLKFGFQCEHGVDLRFLLLSSVLTSVLVRMSKVRRSKPSPKVLPMSASRWFALIFKCGPNRCTTSMQHFSLL